MNEMKQWRCKNGHILGFIRWNSNDVPQLMVLREALNMDVEHPAEVDLFGPLSGTMPVPCSICRDVQVWRITVPVLVEIFEGLDDKTIFEFNQRLVEMSNKMHDPLPGERAGCDASL